VVLYVWRNPSRAWRSASMVSKLCTHARFSFSLRMKRSAQPLPSGARTKAGELSMERQRLLKVIRHGWRTVVVPHGETFGDVFGEAAETLAHALADRL
jgi:hypothetical protein